MNISPTSWKRIMLMKTSGTDFWVLKHLWAYEVMREASFWSRRLQNTLSPVSQPPRMNRSLSPAPLRRGPAAVQAGSGTVAMRASLSLSRAMGTPRERKTWPASWPAHRVVPGRHLGCPPHSPRGHDVTAPAALLGSSARGCPQRLSQPEQRPRPPRWLFWSTGSPRKHGLSTHPRR